MDQGNKITPNTTSLFVYAGNEKFLLDRQVTFATKEGFSLTISGDRLLKILEKVVEEAISSDTSLRFSLPPQ